MNSIPMITQPAHAKRQKAQCAYRLDEQIGYLLRLANQRHLEIFSDQIPSLTPTQFSVLARLLEVGELSQNELGRRVGIDAATTNGVIERLMRKKLIVSKADMNDRRRLCISLTPLGRETVLSIIPSAQTVTANTLGALTTAEAQQLQALLKKLQQS